MDTLSRRSGAVDLTKCLAVFAVVLIHCSANRFALFEIGSSSWLAVLLWNGACKWAVPAFLMCSGALMNAPERELSLGKLFSRYLLRLVAALSVWAALYECLRIWMLRGSGNLSALLLQAGRNWLTGNTYFHLYYFYFAIGLYLALPITRLVCRFSTRQELRYVVLLALATGVVLPSLQFFFPFSLGGPSLLRYILPPVFASAGLGLLGWYLHSTPARGVLRPLLLFAAGFYHRISFYLAAQYCRGITEYDSSGRLLAHICADGRGNLPPGTGPLPAAGYPCLGGISLPGLLLCLSHPPLFPVADTSELF